MGSRELSATSWIARGVARLPAKSLSISVCFSPLSLEHDVYGSPMSNAWSRLTHWWGQKGACADAMCHGTCEPSRRPRPTARDRRPSAQRKADLLDIAHGNGAQFRRPISVRTLARARRFCPWPFRFTLFGTDLHVQPLHVCLHPVRGIPCSSRLRRCVLRTYIVHQLEIALSSPLHLQKNPANRLSLAGPRTCRQILPP